MVGAKRFDEPALSLCHENRLSILAAEGEVGRFPCAELNLPFQFSLRAEYGDGPFEYPCHQEIPLDVGAQAVDVKIVEPLEKFWREKARAIDCAAFVSPAVAEGGGGGERP